MQLSLTGVTRRKLSLSVIAVMVVITASWIAYEVSLTGTMRDAGGQAQRRLALFDRTLETIIERYHYLPAAISQAREARRALEFPGQAGAIEAANGFLSKLNETAGASEIFLMDIKGRVVAASNWWTLTSLVGTDYAFRPYFADAMLRGRAQYYAFGLSTAVPGYFLSERVDGPDGPLGVAVTKINLGEIEATWWRSGELIGIVDVNDVVILSTRPDWRYRPIQTIPATQVQSIATQQRYGDQGIDNKGIIVDRWFSRGAEMALLKGADPDTSGYFLLEELRLPKHGWRLLSFTPMASIYGSALIIALLGGLTCAAILLIGILVVQRRRLIAQRLAAHERLEQRVAERTEDLHAMNEQLRAEIADRVRAEKAERDARDILVQAAKMASLGQALAGVAHEVSQPVAALATHMASARLMARVKRDEEMAGMLANMDKVVDRLATLTGNLKTFARKETRSRTRAELAPVIASALDLADHKLRACGVDVDYRRPVRSIVVNVNAVHIEQVLINLFTNAADAMEHRPVRVLSIAVDECDGFAEVTVSDTGEGIGRPQIDSIFDPFYSTKDAGRGLGLGLSISYGLMRDAGGAISVESRLGRGSVFKVSLPLSIPEKPKRCQHDAA